MSGVNFSGGFSSSNDYSSLFASLNSGTKNSTAAPSNNLFADWASIQNGSYGKLTKAYYGKHSQSVDMDEDEVKTAVRTNNSLKAEHTDLRKAISDIRDAESVFTDKIKTKDANGNEVEDYDYDKIYKLLKSFADSYNGTLDKGVESDNKTILRNTLQMTHMTSTHSKLLSSVGITVGSDNKMTVSEADVKKASMTALKTLFVGMGSYAESIDNNASNIISAVDRDNNKLSNYTANGTFSSSASVGNIYDGSY